MRLINTTSLDLVEFYDANIPQYAILSHTWEPDGEVSFQQFINAKANDKSPIRRWQGYRKILTTCQLARQDGLEWAWIDTCCIDKTSSAELSEAINSMFRWYRASEICYAYLADLEPGWAEPNPALSRCRWFTRGWCLQELIAPPRLELLAKNWEAIGDKMELRETISRITRIDETVLQDSSQLSKLPVGRRMAWAAGRQTMRIEDRAYSLLGLFDVYMPMLYGEGEAAFTRLQEEIIKKFADLSLFAWQPVAGKLPQPKYLGLLAQSPDEFETCFDLTPVGSSCHPFSATAFSITNCGVSMSKIRLTSSLGQGGTDGQWPLGYHHTNHTGNPENESAKIILRKIGPKTFVRITSSRDTWKESCDVRITTEDDPYILSSAAPHLWSSLDRCAEYRIEVKYNTAWCSPQEAEPASRWCAVNSTFLTVGESDFCGYVKLNNPDPFATDNQYFYLLCGFEVGMGRRLPFVSLVGQNDWARGNNMPLLPGNYKGIERPIQTHTFQPLGLNMDAILQDRGIDAEAVMELCGGENPFYVVHINMKS
jgi:hypothetical protein